LAGAAALALALGACATLGLRHGAGVTIHDAFIEIHPGTNISPEDQKELNRILAQYNSRLYKIKRTENGKVSTRGRLKDVLIDERLLAEVRNSGGVSFSALQIGTQAHPDHTFNPDHTDHPEHTDHPNQKSHPNNMIRTDHNEHPTQQIGYKMCSELVKRVTPVLKKYSRD
jgi:hypothetical protein